MSGLLGRSIHLDTVLYIWLLVLNQNVIFNSPPQVYKLVDYSICQLISVLKLENFFLQMALSVHSMSN